MPELPHVEAGHTIPADGVHPGPVADVDLLSGELHLALQAPVCKCGLVGQRRRQSTYLISFRETRRGDRGDTNDKISKVTITLLHRQQGRNR